MYHTRVLALGRRKVEKRGVEKNYKNIFYRLARRFSYKRTPLLFFRHKPKFIFFGYKKKYRFERNGTKSNEPLRMFAIHPA